MPSTNPTLENPPLAAAATASTLWVTTEPPVPPRVSFRLGRCRSSMPLPVSVARPERVARNVRVADMNIDVPVGDARRIEVVCNGLPLWHGAQLAVDATLVSPLTRDGQPQPAANAQPGVALARAEQRKRRHTYPELLRARRCPFVVFGIETGVPPTSRAGPRCQRTCRRVPHCSSRLGVPLEWHPLRCRAASLRRFAARASCCHRARCCW